MPVPTWGAVVEKINARPDTIESSKSSKKILNSLIPKSTSIHTFISPNAINSHRSPHIQILTQADIANSSELKDTVKALSTDLN